MSVEPFTPAISRERTSDGVAVYRDHEGLKQLYQQTLRLLKRPTSMQFHPYMFRGDSSSSTAKESTTMHIALVLVARNARRLLHVIPGMMDRVTLWAQSLFKVSHISHPELALVVFMAYMSHITPSESIQDAARKEFDMRVSSNEHVPIPAALFALHACFAPIAFSISACVSPEKWYRVVRKTNPNFVPGTMVLSVERFQKPTSSRFIGVEFSGELLGSHDCYTNLDVELVSAVRKGCEELNLFNHQEVFTVLPPFGSALECLTSVEDWQSKYDEELLDGPFGLTRRVRFVSGSSEDSEDAFLDVPEDSVGGLRSRPTVEGFVQPASPSTVSHIDANRSVDIEGGDLPKNRNRREATPVVSLAKRVADEELEEDDYVRPYKKSKSFSTPGAQERSKLGCRIGGLMRAKEILEKKNASLQDELEAVREQLTYVTANGGGAGGEGGSSTASMDMLSLSGTGKAATKIRELNEEISRLRAALQERGMPPDQHVRCGDVQVRSMDSNIASGGWRGCRMVFECELREKSRGFFISGAPFSFPFVSFFDKMDNFAFQVSSDGDVVLLEVDSRQQAKR